MFLYLFNYIIRYRSCDSYRCQAETDRPVQKGVQKNGFVEKSISSSGGYKNDDYEVEID